MNDFNNCNCNWLFLKYLNSNSNCNRLTRKKYLIIIVIVIVMKKAQLAHLWLKHIKEQIKLKVTDYDSYLYCG